MSDLEFTIHELLPGGKSIGEYMSCLIDVHARKYPNGNWSPFCSIEYEREIHRLKYVWFPRAIYGQPPARVPVAGLWFGLFLPIRITEQGKETLADFYVSGTKEFCIDGNADWASVPIYVPEDECANSKVLASIYRLAHVADKGFGRIDYQYLCVGFVAAAVAELLKDFDCSLIVGIEEPVGVAVGWNSGDPLYIGHMTRRGFQIRSPEEAIAGIRKRREEFTQRFQARFGPCNHFCVRRAGNVICCWVGAGGSRTGWRSG